MNTTVWGLASLVFGVAAAILATWWRRIVARLTEPILRASNDPLNARHEQHTHGAMTRSEGTRLLLRAGMLVVTGANDVTTR